MKIKKEEFIMDYKNMKIEDMAKKYNVSKALIEYYAKKFGLSKRKLIIE